MENDIINKLKSKFSKPSYEESDVVYILVEIYKFLGQKNNRDFKFISFYRNWVCHHTLDREKSSIDFFKIIINDIQNNGIDINRIMDNLPKTIKTFSLLRLKEELENFSLKYLDNQQLSWQSFKKQLYNVLIDQDIKISIPKYLIFKYKKIPIEAINKEFDTTDELQVELKIENFIISGSYNDFSIENSDN